MSGLFRIVTKSTTLGATYGVLPMEDMLSSQAVIRKSGNGDAAALCPRQENAAPGAIAGATDISSQAVIVFLLVLP
jgi:hypothetical protein